MKNVGENNPACLLFTDSSQESNMVKGLLDQAGITYNEVRQGIDFDEADFLLPVFICEYGVFTGHDGVKSVIDLFQADPRNR